MNWLYEHVGPVLEFFFFILMCVCMLWLLYHFFLGFLKLLKYESRKALLDEKKQLLEEKQQLLEERQHLLAENQRLVEENKQLGNKNGNTAITTIGSLKIKCDTISYIVSKKFEDSQCSDSRVKLIHYIDSEKTDSIYSTFDTIQQQLPTYFMQINKNQIINLKEVFKVQDEELFLKKNKQSFIISEMKKEEFHNRLAMIMEQNN
ncbi:MAG: LytTR family transcriptional regulator DNA-binding domain-containing protein [Bacteroidales bacterium]|nr:LytTR family transcriptional regulator DNA-binding domain-containing protein [Bacteroidales bacterium]